MAIVAQVYLIYKSAIFMFVSDCQKVYNTLASWRIQLSYSLDVIWGRREPGCGLQGADSDYCCKDDLATLIQTYQRLTQLIHQTEKLYSATLQSFYATHIVTLCLELSFLAWGIGVGGNYFHEETVWQTLVILQTFIVFFLVSLKASRVAEEGLQCVALLRRSLPYYSTEKDKYHFEQLHMILTASPVCISGGQYFSITRAFIVTVVGVVLSYFMIVLQVKLPSVHQQRAALLATNWSLDQ
ncbi:odorant receptor coreceptor-like [Scylla paramamosain]|uniref:odorant receptor coreceptor-like n=1 Tax=Scylla paramamosain TaxID=85552 RepID=UPI003082AA98